MSTLFIAVQCFQCSTMQVKQQKKSSNKWSCVICNEKQSVRKIHARGYQAKDVRKFVQGFNASRSDGSSLISPQSDRSEGKSWVEERGGERKRLDWSEYLDPQEDEKTEEEEEGGGFSESVVTTELPSGKFRPSFPKCPSTLHQCQPADGSRHLKLKFSKKRQTESRQGNSGSAKCQRTTIPRAASKWSKYLDKEEEEEEIGLKSDGEEYGLLGGKESMLTCLIVEEELHPDFI